MDANDYVTLPQLESLISRVEGRLVEGFKGVHHRQDIANGRQNATEQVQARHGLLLEQTEKKFKEISRTLPVLARVAAQQAVTNFAKKLQRPELKAKSLGAVGGFALVALIEMVQRLWPVLKGLAGAGGGQ